MSYFEVRTIRCILFTLREWLLIKSIKLFLYYFITLTKTSFTLNSWLILQARLQYQIDRSKVCGPQPARRTIAKRPRKSPLAGPLPHVPARPPPCPAANATRLAHLRHGVQEFAQPSQEVAQGGDRHRWRSYKRDHQVGFK